MSITEVEKARHNLERGAILRALQEDYTSRMTAISTLAGALDLLGYAMTRDSLTWSLNLLADSGYVRVVRADETAAWRRTKTHLASSDAIVFAKILPKGLHLIDEQIDADPMVTFA